MSCHTIALAKLLQYISNVETFYSYRQYRTSQILGNKNYTFYSEIHELWYFINLVTCILQDCTITCNIFTQTPLGIKHKTSKHASMTASVTYKWWAANTCVVLCSSWQILKQKRDWCSRGTSWLQVLPHAADIHVMANIIKLVRFSDWDW